MPQWFSISLKGWTFLKLAKTCLGLFLITFPLQIRTLLYGGTLYVGGNFNPYTVFFLYISDIFLCLSFLLWGMSWWRGEQMSDGGEQSPLQNEASLTVAEEKPVTWTFGYEGLALLLMFFVLTLIATTLGAENKILNLFLSFRFVEFFLLYLLIVNRILSREQLLKFFFAGMVLQAGIAIMQYIQQASLGLRFLGEPLLSAHTPGVAKMDIAGGKLIRPYGTFPHPNVLAGALIAALAFCFYRVKKYYRVLLPLALFFTFALFLTFSRSAFLAVGAGALVYFSLSDQKISLKYIFLGASLLLFFIVLLNLDAIFIQRILFQDDLTAVQERAEYISISRNMLLDHPLGVGLGNFTTFMQDYTPSKLQPWLMQPVHNVFLLITNEAGIASGLLFVFIVLYLFRYLIRALRFVKNNPDEKQFCMLLLAFLTAISVVSLFDHYFYSLYPGQVLLFLYFALASEFLKKSELPRKKS